MLDEKIKAFFADRRRVMVAAAAALACAALLCVTMCRQDAPEADIVPEDAQVTDTLALNILCTPTLESLPLYHALESGLCDSLDLALAIRTMESQFDVDSIIRRTKRIDGAVLDTYRLEHYRKTKRPLMVSEEIPLVGVWSLVTAGQLRIRETSKLKKRTVAFARYATSSNCFERSMAGSGLKTTALYHAQINDYTLRLQMLDEAQIDASVLPEPYATRARLNGHRVIWTADSVKSMVFCMRNKAMKVERKRNQLDLLKRAYNIAAKDLNAHGVHAADSALIKVYGLSESVIDTLSLPKYTLVKVQAKTTTTSHE